MRQEKRGVLMVNLGTPDSPTPQAIKRYLAEFLSDRRVVDLTRWIWWPILYGIILPIRAPRVAKLYRSVWMKDGSPLLVFSRRQQQALAERLPDIPVALGMSYGSPSLHSALDSLLTQGVTQLTVLPLYPQYSCSTTAAVWDGLATLLKQYRRIPAIRFIRDYAEHPAYIAALKHRVEQSFAQYGVPDKLVISFHGIPQRYADEGDDYPLHCAATADALTVALGLPKERVLMTYQSRFGREPWLTPYTDETLKGLPAQGVKHIQVICPGFAADCLETLEEIQEQNRDVFLHAGGERFAYIPALNADPMHIDLFEQLVTQGN
ncbi:ferrochelatase [Pectobacteriaceae bacterium CE70]|uniref:Ferrochelatase n=1 Tax=Serratia sp. (strain ATCC 39006) TaxID=104623 RepID=A0A2I5TAT7_SERS3|nr:ferrochelatase [Serratia sp. ATCC 39006]WJV63698.1 ferrochelatase [Pectobacteriaceae bacterium C52]WJV68093.1 ferrochelatase [Pectobacteriaceae bacterium CE70]WJY12031.1 ferrochelatase [Pectobacteriaceae bacterium C80]AUH01669.1 ferrochelatase [Serratia sp. ATCC 39006]AUH05992.1 ferrochelatase [Serratia sp. ATCC 39006]